MKLFKQKKTDERKNILFGKSWQNRAAHFQLPSLFCCFLSLLRSFVFYRLTVDELLLILIMTLCLLFHNSKANCDERGMNRMGISSFSKLVIVWSNNVSIECLSQLQFSILHSILHIINVLRLLLRRLKWIEHFKSPQIVAFESLSSEFDFGDIHLFIPSFSSHFETHHKLKVTQKKPFGMSAVKTERNRNAPDVNRCARWTENWQRRRLKMW